MTKTLKKLMIAEDQALTAADLEQRLTSLGYAVTAIADTASDALQELEHKHADLWLGDIHIRGPVDGVTLGEQVKHRYKLPVIFLTAYADAGALADFLSVHQG